ncbi:PREDICTED: uncharacterized protein LOC105313782 [Amphimedon queenslandica]|uniref:protein-tyrosine-phosphatase n=1 Tax=Amphimedon queenslandica TaxID=400682 RepID=A0AAN0IP53_AMPQE|nr:PREDICTED: uncharacterized protein LOC105313782 [Amphimedon queenslandica]|eukprot:XP_011405784.2 PREDICTED: uncharacterized protein LOC105313782 [Amphimedon queenslandica]
MFSVTKLNSTAVRAEWNLILRASHYTVYYESTSSSSRKKRQVETGMRVFPGGTTEGLIGGLDPNLNYLFSISISFTVNGVIYEGERTQPIQPADIPTSTSDAANGSSVIFIVIGAVVCILVLIVTITIIVVVNVLKKRRGSNDIDIVSKNTSTNKPEATVYYSTCRNSNNEAGYEEIGLERIEEATYSTVMKPKKPVIEEFPSNMTTEEGCQVLLKVKVKDTSKPSFNWYHNGDLVTDDYAHELRGDGSLLLVSVEEKHKGTYRFVANNDAGTVSQQVVLTVAVEGARRMPSNGTSAVKSGKNLIPVRQFGEFVANGHAKGNEGFKNQFMMLDSGESDHTGTAGLTPSNKLLNRFANIVVSRNFWKMIDDRNVTAIVMLCQEKENDLEVCYQYWPSTSSGIILGEYNITLLKENTSNRYIERKFEVKNTNTGAKQSVTQFQVTNWDSTGEVKNPQTILMIIEEMYKTQRKRGNTSIVVHCSDTVGRSAIFCAAATTINKCKTEGVIDVFQVLKSQRIQKPGSVQTVQQYQGIFQIVLTYLDSFETYSNFTK